MDLYTYIANNNPYQAKSILHKFGYSFNNIKTDNDLGLCLKQLVAREGENAFNDILQNHPDKGVIIESFLNENKDDYQKKSNCNCSEKNFMNFNGQNDNRNSNISKETNVFILAAALILAAAIIVKN